MFCFASVWTLSVSAANCEHLTFVSFVFVAV